MPSSSTSAADSCPDLHRATISVEENVHTTNDTNSTINDQIDALPSTHESNNGDRHQSAEADFEILVKPSHSTKPDNPSAQFHPPHHLHHLDLLTSATTSATTSSSHHRGLGEGVEESDDGFRTPTNTIPSTAECPPAPKKAKIQKRSMSSLLQEESSQLYCRNDLVMEVEMWLEFLEEEDGRKRLTKKARRQQASKLADATSTSHQLSS